MAERLSVREGLREKVRVDLGLSMDLREREGKGLKREIRGLSGCYRFQKWVIFWLC